MFSKTGIGKGNKLHDRHCAEIIELKKYGSQRCYLGARTVSEDGAFWSLIVGFITMVVWTVLGSLYEIHIAIPTILSVFTSSIAISAFLKRKKALSVC